MSISLQRANFWKRISAFLFDIILTVIVTVGFATAMSAIIGYNGYIDRYTEQCNDYAELVEPYRAQYEAEYGIDFDISYEDYEKLSDEEKANYPENYEQNYNDATTALNAVLKTDAAVLEQAKKIQESFYKLFNMTVLILSISLFLAVFVFYFVLPLLLHNGQTLGKKIFGIAVMRTNGVKISNFVLFVRSILGMYTIELMVPIILVLLIYFGILGIVGTITIGLILLLDCAVMIATRTNSSIHDLLSDTVVVDMASQQIFDSEEALKAYEEALRAEAIAKGELAPDTSENEPKTNSQD